MSNLMREMETATQERVFRPQGHCFVKDISTIFEINDKDGLLGQGVSGKVYKTCLAPGVVSPNPNVVPNTYYALKCMNVKFFFCFVLFLFSFFFLQKMFLFCYYLRLKNVFATVLYCVQFDCFLLFRFFYCLFVLQKKKKKREKEINQSTNDFK